MSQGLVGGLCICEDSFPGEMKVSVRSADRDTIWGGTDTGQGIKVMVGTPRARRVAGHVETPMPGDWGLVVWPYNRPEAGIWVCSLFDRSGNILASDIPGIGGVLEHYYPDIWSYLDNLGNYTWVHPGVNDPATAPFKPTFFRIAKSLNDAKTIPSRTRNLDVPGQEHEAGRAFELGAEDFDLPPREPIFPYFAHHTSTEIYITDKGMLRAAVPSSITSDPPSLYNYMEITGQDASGNPLNQIEMKTEAGWQMLLKDDATTQTEIIYKLIAPSGNQKFEIDDKSGQQKVTIEAATGRTIVIDVPTKKLTITMGGNIVVIDENVGDMTITTVRDLIATVGRDMTATVTGTTTLTATSETVINTTGGDTTVNASGTVKLGAGTTEVVVDGDSVDISALLDSTGSPCQGSATVQNSQSKVKAG